MKYRNLIALLASLAALALLTLPAAAKGTPNLVEIEIPGFYAPLRVEDGALLWDLSLGRLENLEAQLESPADIGTGVVLTRFYLDNEGNEVPFDRVAYFEDRSGGPGYVFYVGIVNGSSEYDGHWFEATDVGHQAVSHALEANHVNLEVASEGSSLRLPTWLWPAMLSGLAGFALAWPLAKRRGTY